jgi:hypothetical protein
MLKFVPDTSAIGWGLVFLILGIAGFVYEHFIDPERFQHPNLRAERIPRLVGDLGLIILGLSSIILSSLRCQ